MESWSYTIRNYVNNRLMARLAKTTSSWQPGSEPRAPAVLPSDADGIEVGSAAGRDSRVEIELDRVVPAKRLGERRPPARVLLHVVVRLAVDQGAPATVIGRIERRPQARSEVVDHVCLHAVERLLLADIASQELVVIGKESNARRRLERLSS